MTNPNMDPLIFIFILASTGASLIFISAVLYNTTNTHCQMSNLKHNPKYYHPKYNVWKYVFMFTAVYGSFIND